MLTLILVRFGVRTQTPQTWMPWGVAAPAVAHNPRTSLALTLILTLTRALALTCSGSHAAKHSCSALRLVSRHFQPSVPWRSSPGAGRPGRHPGGGGATSWPGEGGGSAVARWRGGGSLMGRG